MLSIEDQRELGIARPARRASAVSQALRAVARDLDGADAVRLPVAGAPPARDAALAATREFLLLAACDARLRERAYRLAYDAYHRKGYVPQSREEVLVAPYDAAPGTLTVLAEDRDGRAAGTISVVPDAPGIPGGLPCAEIFGAELAALRARGARVAEVTRLAIDDAHAHSRELLALLCNVPFTYALRVCGCTDLVIEVNPRHVPFYAKLLKFEPLGPERPCPRVNGAPAVLLGVSLDLYAHEVSLGRRDGSADSRRSLYASFCAGAAERAFVMHLSNSRRPMSWLERARFGLTLAAT